MKNNQVKDIFRAYDIRGIFPDQINENVALKVSNATAHFFLAKKIVVGLDVRNSSPELANKVIEGATLAGSDVLFIGHTTTPLFYFAVKELGADAGIMVTASHNPKEYNGLKIVGPGASHIGLDSGLKNIKVMSGGPLFEASVSGMIYEEDGIKNKYIDFLFAESKGSTRKLKLVIDAGNGSAAIVLKPLLERLKMEYEPLFFNIDGSFPGRGPNPDLPEATQILSNKVKELNADMGIAFDGDADRVIFLDEKGKIISPQFILALLWQSSGSKIRAVYDLRFSKMVRDLIGQAGFKSRVGHSYMYQVMKERDADIGAETSGHFFFKEMAFSESAILAMIMVINALSQSDKSLSNLIEPFLGTHYSGEIDINIGSKEEGFQEKLFKQLKEKYKDEVLEELDGLTIEHWSNQNDPNRWWFNVRVSNTEPILRLVVEAGDDNLMNDKIEEIKKAVS